MLGELVANAGVFHGKTIALFFQGLDIFLLPDKFLSEARALITAFLTSDLLLKLHLEIEVLNNEVLGSVQDQREKEGKSAEVHVSLGVELSRLNLHALGTNRGPVVAKRSVLAS